MWWVLGKDIIRINSRLGRARREIKISIKFLMSLNEK